MSLRNEGKLSPETGEQEPNNTQENGPLKKQTEMPPPFKVSEENPTRVKKEATAHSGQLAMQCASGSLREERAKVNWKAASDAEEDDPASTQDRIPDSVKPEAVCPDNPPHTETNTTSEQTALSAAHHDEEEKKKVTVEAVAKPAGEFLEDQQVLSVPHMQLAAAPQVSSVPVVNEEPEPEPLTR